MPNKYIKHRVVKFKLEKGQADLEDLAKSHKSLVNKTNDWVFGKISSGKIILKTTKGDPGTDSQYVKYLGGDSRLSHAKMKEYNVLGFGDFVSANFAGYQAKYWRGIVQYVFDRYKSFYNRNKKEIESGRKSVNRISIKAKELQFKNQMVELDKDNNQLKIYTHLSSVRGPVTLNYDTKNSFLNHIDGLGSSQCDLFGGNLVIDQGIFAACCTYEEEYAYDPVDSIAIDVNKTDKDWIALSQPVYGKSTFPKIDTGKKDYSNVVHVEKLLKLYNDKLNSRFRRKEGKKTLKNKTGDRPFGHAKANSFRKKVQSLHRAQNRLIEKALKESRLLEYVKENKLLLCLDGVTTGQTNGTFGQDKITPILVKLCENLRIPFLVPPTFNTSIRCPSCNHVSKENRKEASNFKCVSCGHKADAQFVGAHNTARTGLWLWENHYDPDSMSKWKSKSQQGSWNSLITNHFSSTLARRSPPPIGKASITQIISRKSSQTQTR
jgi:transposase